MRGYLWYSDIYLSIYLYIISFSFSTQQQLRRQYMSRYEYTVAYPTYVSSKNLIQISRYIAHPDLPNVDSNGGYIRFQIQALSSVLLSLQQKILMKKSAVNCTISIM